MLRQASRRRQDMATTICGAGFDDNLARGAANGASPGCRCAASTVWPRRTARRPGGQQLHLPDAIPNHRRTAAPRGCCDRGSAFAEASARQAGRAPDVLNREWTLTVPDAAN